MKSTIALCLLALLSTQVEARDCAIRVTSKTSLKLFGSLIGAEKISPSVETISLTLLDSKKVLKTEKVKVDLEDGMMNEEDVPKLESDCRKAKKKLKVKAMDKGCQEEVLMELAQVSCAPF